MGEPQPAFAKQTGIRLEDLTPQIKSQELEKRLAAAFDRAVAVVETKIQQESKDYRKKLKDAGTDVGKLAKILESAPVYVPINLKGSKLEARGGTQEQLDEYLKRLQEIGDNQDLSLAESFSEMAKVIEDAGQNGIKIKVISTFEVVASTDFIKSTKDDFVKNVSLILRNGFKGSMSTPAPFAFEEGYEAIAKTFGEAVQREIGLQRPSEFQEGGEGIAFGDARVPKGHYPIEITVEGPKVEMVWAPWIIPVTTKIDFDSEKGAFLDKVPKKKLV
ncbi:hypothetical protein J4450_00600 [Candidatus Micrarchaeota archaeon]|nr:hypothetical protein [Candidatus Micrarchaeota archaeon]